MEADLRTYLTGEADISALISSRMYLSNAPQGAARPLIVYRLLGTEHHRTLRDYNLMTTDTFELDLQSYTDTGAKALKEAVRKKLDTFRGTMGSTYVHNAKLTDETDDYTVDQSGRDRGIYHCLLEFDIWHSETAPSV